MENFESLNIEVPEKAPFKNDMLNREGLVTMMTNIFTKFNKGAVVAIDAPWGTGKTTFIKMLMATLKNGHYTSLYFNAWESDYTDDPLCALISELIGNKFLPTKLKENIGRLAISGGKEMIKAIIKTTTGIDSKAIEAAIDEAAIIGINSYKERKQSIQDFKDSLTEFVTKSYEEDTECKLPILFFVDELDRCNPHYAVKVLERIKHCFTIPDIVFILSIDKAQLKNSVQGYFGSNNIDADEYLRRFIDIEYTFPLPNYLSYCNYLSKKFDVDYYLQLDGVRSSEEINEIVANMGIKVGLTLRQLEKFYGHLYLVCSSFSAKNLSHYVAFFLLLLKFYPNTLDNIEHKHYSLSELHQILISVFPNTLDDYNYFIGQILGLYGRFASLINTRESPENWIKQTNDMTDDAHQMLFSGIRLTAIDSTGFYPRLENILDHIHLYSKISRF